MHDIYYMT